MLNKRILVLMFLLAFLFMVGCIPSTPPVDENQAPVIISVPITDAEVGVGYIYNVGATDPDEDSLIYSLIVKPNGMFINSITGLISWNPNSAQVGNNSVTVEVSDGELSDTQSFIIVVEEPCVPPCPPDPCDPPCPPTPQEVKLISIVVVPKTMTLFVGETEDIVSVTAHYNDGSTFVINQQGDDYGNGSDDNSVATVSVSHVVTAVAKGTATITVMYEDKTDTIEVTVAEVEVIGIEISPDEKTLLVGGTQFLTVTAFYNDGTDAIISGLDCVFAPDDLGWIVSVSSEGLVTAEHNGKVEINVFYIPDSIVFVDTAIITVGPVHNVTQDFYRDTIQDAIDDALTSAGDTIEVSAGTYIENVVIPADKDNLQLIGAGSGLTSIAPASNRALALQGYPVGRPIDGVKVKGFTLETPNAYAFIALSSTPDDAVYTTNLELEDIVVDGGIYGICLNAVQGVTFTDVHISNISIIGQGGIEMTGVSDFTFTQGSIVGNYIGIRLQPTGPGDIGDGYGPNGNIQIHNSSLNGNVFAVENQDASTIIGATNNWWGDASGPYHVSTNPLGLGNVVSDYVDYSSWSTSP